MFQVAYGSVQQAKTAGVLEGCSETGKQVGASQKKRIKKDGVQKGLCGRNEMPLTVGYRWRGKR